MPPPDRVDLDALLHRLGVPGLEPPRLPDRPPPPGDLGVDVERTLEGAVAGGEDPLAELERALRAYESGRETPPTTDDFVMATLMRWLAALEADRQRPDGD